MATPSSLTSPSQVSPRHLARPQNTFKGCSRITDYEVLGKLGEGTFGEVHRARSKKTGSVVALKKILMHNEKDGFPITALREIKLLKLLSHENILRLEEMAVEHHTKGTDKKKRAIMYMVTPYMDHDLSGLLENPSVTFTEPQIKCYMIQLLKGLAYLHDQNILHRDMKAANLLINNKGILQIADFGLARHYDEEVPVKGRGGGVAKRDYTTLVVTRWYRPPELLMSLRRYTTAIDLWGVGCVFGEMLVGKPILAGDSDQNQLKIIFDLVGSPTEDNMPGWRTLPGAEGLNPPVRPPTLSQRFRKYGPGAISLLNELLKLDWRKRVNAMDALEHPYFQNHPYPAKPNEIPTFEESHELDRRKFRNQKVAPPPAPKGGTVGMGPENGNGGAWGTQHGGRDPSYRNGDRNGYRQDYQNGNRYPPPHDSRHRLPPPPPPHAAPPSRRPAWQRDDAPEVRLPPRPSLPLHPDTLNYDGARSDRDYRSRSRDIERGPPPIYSRGPPPTVDTYIPSYGPDSDRPPRPPRDDRPRSRDDRPRDDRDRLRDDRSRDDRPRRRDDRDDRRHHVERDRHRDTLDYDERAPRATRTRSRSRSPIRDRERPIRDREPLDPRDREREIYRR